MTNTEIITEILAINNRNWGILSLDIEGMGSFFKITDQFYQIHLTYINFSNKNDCKIIRKKLSDLGLYYVETKIHTENIFIETYQIKK